jgi:hypothetical protein
VISAGSYLFIVERPITAADLDTEMDTQLGSIHGGRTGPA